MATWLARLLSRSTSTSLKKTGTWAKLESKWTGTLKVVDVLHKYDHYDLGGELVYVRQCHSVRVAYSIVAETEGGDVGVST